MSVNKLREALHLVDPADLTIQDRLNLLNLIAAAHHQNSGGGGRQSPSTVLRRSSLTISSNENSRNAVLTLVVAPASSGVR